MLFRSDRPRFATRCLPAVVLRPDATEPAWHRNLRTRRQRARCTIRAAKAGLPVDHNRLLAAQRLLADHHGTRGSGLSDMAPKSTSEWTRVGRDGRPANIPSGDDWICQKCTKDIDDGMPHCVWARKDRCNRDGCNKIKPKNPQLFKNSRWGKAVAAAANNWGWRMRRGRRKRCCRAVVASSKKDCGSQGRKA